MPASLSVVLTSGGLDSAVAAAMVRQTSAVALLHFDYGQKAADREAEAFAAMREHFKPVDVLTMSLGDWKDLSPSSLLGKGRDIEDAATVRSLASSFVPMLAPAMLCAAAGWAYAIGADRVVWGVSMVNLGHYPDRVDTVRLLALQLAARALPEDKAPIIEAPLVHYDKPAVGELARQLKVPVELTWSCLRNGPQPCGQCIGCVSRARAVKQVASTRGPAKAKA